MSVLAMGRSLDISQESLNGAWDFCAWEDEQPPQQIPAGLRWQGGAYQVVASPRVGGQAAAGLLRRTLPIQERAGLRAWLRFERTGGPAVFFLNGRRFYASPETWLPVEMDIQDHAILSSGAAAGAGENELVIWRGPGFAALQGAELAYLPAVSLPDLVVRPRKGSLDLACSLENRTWEHFEGRLDLRLLERGQEGMLLASQEVALERGLLTTLAMRANWDGGRPWSLDAPWLYELEVSLYGAGGLLDARRVRFGLREVRKVRENWILNGKRAGPVRGYNPEASDPEAALAALAHMKEAGATVLHLDSPYPAVVLDCADQLGLLVESHSANWFPDRSAAAEPAFQDANEDHLRRLARRDRNHPSLAGWYLDGEGQDFGEMAHVLRAMDPTRPVFVSGSL